MIIKGARPARSLSFLPEMDRHKNRRGGRKSWRVHSIVRLLKILRLLHVDGHPHPWMNTALE